MKIVIVSGYFNPVHKYGGGAFIIPYMICFLTLSVPLFYLETILGQLYEKSPSKLYSYLGKKYTGLGLFPFIS